MATDSAATAWLEQQLERALAQLETLGRDVDRLRAALGAREQEVDDLRQALALVEGRTQRHEAGPDVARELRQAVAAFEERLAEETSVRREHASAVERVQQRERDAEQAVARTLVELRDRLAQVERSLLASGERQSHFGADVAGQEAAAEHLAARIDALAVRLEAVAESATRHLGGTTLLEDTLAQVERRLQTLDARTEQLHREQQRFDEALFGLRRIAEREEALADLLEQQRALRQRVEEGLSSLDARLSASEDAAVLSAEDGRLLRVRVEGIERQVGEVGAQLAAQREALLEHFRRATAAAEQAGRRQIEEIDRQARASRELLVRLTESADATAQEQPL